MGYGTCCTPNAGREPGALDLSKLPRRKLSDEGMIHLEGGPFAMGAEGPECWEADGEGPVREVTLRPFLMDAAAVTNRQFAEFIEETGYQTETERFAWSFVHHSQLSKAHRKRLKDLRVLGLEWWYRVDGAFWKKPFGRGGDIEKLGIQDHPVVHVTWHDAAAYAHWAGKRLPTEAEWEFASRGGLEQKRYPWGDELRPGGKHRCNIWQGRFPVEDLGEDGWKGTAPAREFSPNGFGLWNTTGNVWEWVADWFDPAWHRTAPRENPVGPPRGQARVMRGGSYLCHRSYCNRYRCAARTSNTPDTSTGHVGFRCAADI